jgi:rhodanese-related sulfurtransferase
VNPQTIEPQELDRRRQQGESVDLIDVRTPLEFREVHVDFALNLPLGSLDPHAVMSRRDSDRDRPLYVICHGGDRASLACQKFQACGYDNVVSVSGGTRAWDGAGLPVVRGKRAISLEQQVRIAAGFLAAAGSALAFFVHPGFLIVPAGVGVGLMHAGVTNSCIMGVMLAKMPWNQVRCDPSSTESGETATASCCS